MTNDMERPRRLREVAEQLAAKISGPPRRGRDVSNEPRLPKGQSGGGQWTTDGSTSPSQGSRRLANSHTPVPFVDDYGNPILDIHGQPMQRPSDLDLHFFVDEGHLMAEAEQNVFTAPSAIIATIEDLYNFRRGGPWDIQRVGPEGEYVEPYVDAANVAIGLYCAAAGLPESMALDIANRYAKSSDFGGAERDPNYTNLRKDNVHDIKTGYDLVRTGKIAPTGDR